jgi:hypothetical protein
MRRFIFLFIAVFAAPAAGAIAAPPRTGAPATAVETQAPGGATVRLLAQDAATGGLCLDVAVDQTVREDGVCPRPSQTAADDLRPRLVRAGGHTVLYGAVSNATATVELTLSTGRRVRAATQRGRDYRGAWAARVRFYVAAVAGEPTVAAVRALDARGRTRAAADVNRLALPPRRGRAVLASVVDETGHAAELLALDTRILTPTRSRPDRRTRALCVGLRSREPSSSATGRAICTTRPRQLEVRFAADCGTGRTILYGVVPSIVRRVDVVLAGGAQRRMRVIAVPRRLGHRSRGVVLVLERGSAESVIGYDARGRRLATIQLAGGECS